MFASAAPRPLVGAWTQQRHPRGNPDLRRSPSLGPVGLCSSSRNCWKASKCSIQVTRDWLTCGVDRYFDQGLNTALQTPVVIVYHRCFRNPSTQYGLHVSNAARSSADRYSSTIIYSSADSRSQPLLASHSENIKASQFLMSPTPSLQTPLYFSPPRCATIATKEDDERSLSANPIHEIHHISTTCLPP